MGDPYSAITNMTRIDPKEILVGECALLNLDNIQQTPGKTYDYRDVVGTSPWMESVESRRERRPRTMQEQLSRATHDCMDAGAVAEDAKAEERYDCKK